MLLDSFKIQLFRIEIPNGTKEILRTLFHFAL